MIHDSDDDRMPRLYMALWTLVLLFIAFAWGAWVQRSDARALEQIASEGQILGPRRVASEKKL